MGTHSFFPKRLYTSPSFLHKNQKIMQGSLYLTSTHQPIQTRPLTTPWEPACQQPGTQSLSWSLHNQSSLKPMSSRETEVQSNQGAAEFWEAWMPRRPSGPLGLFSWQICGLPKLPCFTSPLSLVTAQDVSPFGLLCYTLIPMLLCASPPVI